MKFRFRWPRWASNRRPIDRSRATWAYSGAMAFKPCNAFIGAIKPPESPPTSQAKPNSRPPSGANSRSNPPFKISEVRRGPAFPHLDDFQTLATAGLRQRQTDPSFTISACRSVLPSTIRKIQTAFVDHLTGIAWGVGRKSRHSAVNSIARSISPHVRARTHLQQDSSAATMEPRVQSQDSDDSERFRQAHHGILSYEDLNVFTRLPKAADCRSSWFHSN